MSGRRRVGFLHTHPIQYHAPFYRFVNESSEQLEAVPLYLSDWGVTAGYDAGFGQSLAWDRDLITGTNAVFVGDAQGRTLERLHRIVVPQVWRAVRDNRLSALTLYGHAVPSNYLALLAAKADRIPVLYRSDANPLVRSPSRARRVGRQAYLHAFYRAIDGFLVGGLRNGQFYRQMGVPDRKLFPMPLAIDNDAFASASAIDPAERREIRARHGIADELPVVLFASKLQRRKRADDMISAAFALHDAGVRYHTLIVGSGETEQALRARAATRPEVSIQFGGFANQTELPRIFGASDVFVLPSEQEPFGLIINEAMAAGLPIMTTRDVGAAPDLVRPGENGLTYAAGDIPAMAAGLKTLLDDAAGRHAAGVASRRIIAGWSYQQAMEGLETAVAAISPSGSVR